jgi:hypothetical protein
MKRERQVPLMKILAGLIRRQLQLEPNDLGHCAVYEKELQRVWPITEKNRKAKIEQFAREHGFRLAYYKQGLCTIFEEASPDGDSERTGDTNPENERKGRVSKPCTQEVNGNQFLRVPCRIPLALSGRRFLSTTKPKSGTALGGINSIN